MTDYAAALATVGRTAPGSDREAVIAHIAEGAKKIRLSDIAMVRAARAGHIGGAMSITDVLATLYLHVLNIDPSDPTNPERDRLVLSKGHVAGVLYTALAAAGMLDPGELRTFLQPESMLNGHPDRNKVTGVEANTGPLGHGLPIAVGMAIAARLDGSNRRTFVILGDGELQEGSNWEALMTAGNRRLANLTAVVDRNRLQQGAKVEETNDLEPLVDKLRAFNWDVVEVDGHDHGQLLDALTACPSPTGRPTFVIAHTFKGHPISYMSDNVAWHHKVPDDEQTALALQEVEQA